MCGSCVSAVVCARYCTKPKGSQELSDSLSGLVLIKSNFSRQERFSGVCKLGSCVNCSRDEIRSCYRVGFRFACVPVGTIACRKFCMPDRMNALEM